MFGKLCFPYLNAYEQFEAADENELLFHYYSKHLDACAMICFHINGIAKNFKYITCEIKLAELDRQAIVKICICNKCNSLCHLRCFSGCANIIASHVLTHCLHGVFPPIHYGVACCIIICCFISCRHCYMQLFII